MSTLLILSFIRGSPSQNSIADRVEEVKLYFFDLHEISVNPSNVGVTISPSLFRQSNGNSSDSPESIRITRLSHVASSATMVPRDPSDIRTRAPIVSGFTVHHRSRPAYGLGADGQPSRARAARWRN
jgi:hypothetical protein